MQKNMNKPYQRVGSKSNAHVGKKFELSAQRFFQSRGLNLKLNVKIEVGVSNIKKPHAFDLGSKDIIVECKSHKWTSGSNVPSAKLTAWNEAMYYFVTAPEHYRKIMFVLRDYSTKREKTLAEYYIRTYKHLIPSSVEIWEYNESTNNAVQLYPL